MAVCDTFATAQGTRKQQQQQQTEATVSDNIPGLGATWLTVLFAPPKTVL
jgi:C4-dicarboxylate-specific signal transduction histidine kinase